MTITRANHCGIEMKPSIDPQEEIRKSIDFMKAYAMKTFIFKRLRPRYFRRTGFYTCRQASADCSG